LQKLDPQDLLRWNDSCCRDKPFGMIAHIVKRRDWELAVGTGTYAPDSLRVEGFIHCSTLAQVVDTADRFYRGQDDLVVLCIEESRLNAELKYEAPTIQHGESAGTLFPHLYGELNVDAVVRVVALPCQVDGSFRLPDELQK
jgi:uncharacterized protein (DUF952 family)